MSGSPRNGVVTVLLNPRAGVAGASGRSDELEELFRDAGVTARIRPLSLHSDPGHAAREAARSSDVVVAAGGDGTVSAVAATLAGGPVALGVLPLGTLNHFARDVHIPLDLKQAVAVIAAGRTTAVDVGRVNDRVFLNNASVGLYPDIVELRDKLRRRGQRKWRAFVSATARVVWTYRGMTVHIESDEAAWAGRTPFVFVGNNAYTVDGLRLGSRETLCAGRLVAYASPRVRSRALPLLVARALAGRGLKSGAFAIVAGRELLVHPVAGPRVRVAIDGEVTTMTAPLRFQSVRRALNVLTPAP